MIAYGQPGAAVLIALAAVWLPSALTVATIHTRRPR